MTRLPGDRPERQKNFHGSDGRHLFPHPRTYAQKSQWTAWDRRYAAHLDRHKELISEPEPQPGDSKAVLALIEHREHLKKILEKEAQLIQALRQRAAAYPEADDTEHDEAVRRIVRTGEGP